MLPLLERLQDAAKCFDLAAGRSEGRPSTGSALRAARELRQRPGESYSKPTMSSARRNAEKGGNEVGSGAQGTILSHECRSSPKRGEDDRIPSETAAFDSKSERFQASTPGGRPQRPLAPQGHTEVQAPARLPEALAPHGVGLERLGFHSKRLRTCGWKGPSTDSEPFCQGLYGRAELLERHLRLHGAEGGSQLVGRPGRDPLLDVAEGSLKEV